MPSSSIFPPSRNRSGPTKKAISRKLLKARDRFNRCSTAKRCPKRTKPTFRRKKWTITSLSNSLRNPTANGFWKNPKNSEFRQNRNNESFKTSWKTSNCPRNNLIKTSSNMNFTFLLSTPFRRTNWGWSRTLWCFLLKKLVWKKSLVPCLCRGWHVLCPLQEHLLHCEKAHARCLGTRKFF